MPRKLIYSYIKDYIENFGYTLISSEYVNSKTKLEIQCDKGHIYKAHFNSFKNGCRCPVCNGSFIYSYEYVKNYIENEGYKLLSTEYIRNNKYLKMMCPNGHIYISRFDNFKNNNTRCKICAGKEKYSYEYVKNYIENEGYKLLSTEYENANKYLKISCNNNHIYETTFHNFKRGYRCSKCKVSGPEKEIVNYVKSIYFGKLIENDRKTLINPNTNHWLELDIYLPILNKAIEFNGYYHYLEEHKNRDKIKKIQCDKLGINLFVIDGNKYRNNKQEVLQKVHNFINNIE